LTRKNLTLDAERLRTLAAPRGESGSAAAREAIAAALLADEFVDLLRRLHDAGFAVDGAAGRRAGRAARGQTRAHPPLPPWERGRG
jgi:hypothetical protein